MHTHLLIPANRNTIHKTKLVKYKRNFQVYCQNWKFLIYFYFLLFSAPHHTTRILFFPSLHLKFTSFIAWNFSFSKKKNRSLFDTFIKVWNFKASNFSIFERKFYSFLVFILTLCNSVQINIVLNIQLFCICLCILFYLWY